MVASKVVRELMAEHGEVRNQQQGLWRGEIPLPDPIERFYKEIGPVDVSVPGYGNGYFFPSLARLWEHQAGYRWHGLTGEPSSAWDPAWIVVADCGADPFIFSTTTQTVLGAEHGMRTWDPGEAFTDLNTMAACIATLGSVVNEAGRDFTDDDSYIKPQHRARAVERIAELIGDRTEADHIVADAGWD